MQKSVSWANLKPVFRQFMEVCILRRKTAEKNTEAVLVRFTTSEDAKLGPVDMYLDEQGNLLGMGLRE